MIGVEQTLLAPPDGNCLAACIASIFEMDLDEVCPLNGEDWFERLNAWLRPRNLTSITFGVSDTWVPVGYSILGARSPRGDWLHAVVCLDGDVVWDPHPERHMGIGEHEDWTVFSVIDPSRPVLGRLR